MAVPKLPLFIDKSAPFSHHLIAYELGGITQECDGGFAVRYNDREGVILARQRLVGSLTTGTFTETASVLLTDLSLEPIT